MIEPRRIITECHTDTLVVERVLGIRRIIHAENVQQVFITLQKRYSGQKAVGIIDNDKKKHPRFSEFQQSQKHGPLSRMALPTEPYGLIVVNPAIDGLLWDAAKDVGVDPADYSFRTFKYFRSVTKSADADRNQDLLQFVNTLIQKKAPPLVTLKSWIHEILG